MQTKRTTVISEVVSFWYSVDNGQDKTWTAGYGLGTGYEIRIRYSGLENTDWVKNTD